MIGKTDNKKCCYINCKKKLTMLDFNCKCGSKYCSLHRLPEDHECKFSHKETEKSQLKEKLYNNKIISDKVHNKL